MGFEDKKSKLTLSSNKINKKVEGKILTSLLQIIGKIVIDRG
jgi:hypothetical protein